ncbi:MAG: EscU/YscU/HrcU family type III secretion system export apparatus switch protein [Desulfosarcinaceae bacterium]
MTEGKEKHIKRAAALKYDSTKDGAPRVVAKGRGKMAQKIIDLAREHQVPLVENPGLARLLDALDLDMDIPPDLYRAVAEVLVFVYRLDQGRL